jgi:hypothetical protein
MRDRRELKLRDDDGSYVIVQYTTHFHICFVLCCSYSSQVLKTM